MSQIMVRNVQKEFYVNIMQVNGIQGIIKNLLHRKKKVICAVDGLDFDINKGEIIGFLGPNGAGKSTTIKMLSGILTPTSGEIKVCDIIPYKHRMQRI